MRKVIAINQKTGERKEFKSTYAAAVFLLTATQNVMQALDRGGVCCGWKLYDTPERIQKRIEQLNKMLEEAEAVQ